MTSSSLLLLLLVAALCGVAQARWFLIETEGGKTHRFPLKSFNKRPTKIPRGREFQEAGGEPSLEEGELNEDMSDDYAANTSAPGTGGKNISTSATTPRSNLTVNTGAGSITPSTIVSNTNASNSSTINNNASAAKIGVGGGSSLGGSPANNETKTQEISVIYDDIGDGMMGFGKDIGLSSIGGKGFVGSGGGGNRITSAGVIGGAGNIRGGISGVGGITGQSGVGAAGGIRGIGGSGGTMGVGGTGGLGGAGAGGGVGGLGGIGASGGSGGVGGVGGLAGADYATWMDQNGKMQQSQVPRCTQEFGPNGDIIGESCVL